MIRSGIFFIKYLEQKGREEKVKKIDEEENEEVKTNLIYYTILQRGQLVIKLRDMVLVSIFVIIFSKNNARI